jgi:hypothetical protein
MTVFIPEDGRLRPKHVVCVITSKRTYLIGVVLYGYLNFCYIIGMCTTEWHTLKLKPFYIFFNLITLVVILTQGLLYATLPELKCRLGCLIGHK